MKRIRTRLLAVLLGAFGSLGFLSLLMYPLAFPVRRHPYAYPFWVTAGTISALICMAAFSLLVYYITKTAYSARGRQILSAICLTVLAFAGCFFIWAYGLDFAAQILHRLDP